MKIGINSTFRRFPPCGQGRYLTSLVTAVRCHDPSSQYIEMGPPLLGYAGRVRKSLGEAWWELVSISWVAKKHKLDLLHNPYWTAPLLPYPKTVVTVHDVVPILPGFELYRRGWPSKVYYDLISRTLRSAGAIIADTNAAADDIRRVVEPNYRRLHIIPLAPEDRFRETQRQTEVEDVCRRFGLNLPYVIYVASGFDFRKNLRRTIEAFEIAAAATHTRWSLVIVGDLRSTEYPASDDLRPFVAERKLTELVKFTGYVSDEDMPKLYQGASISLCSSIYEGGGLSMMEAMASGKAVIASDLKTLREIIGDAALFVDPFNPGSIAKALRTLLEDPRWREELGQHARKRACSIRGNGRPKTLLKCIVKSQAIVRKVVIPGEMLCNGIHILTLKHMIF